MPKLRVLIAITSILLITSCAINMARYRQAMPVGMSECSDCHIILQDGTLSDRGSKLSGSINIVCTGCHSNRIAQGEHGVGMEQKSKTVLPLYDGRVECPTCHEPHGLGGNHAMLRLPADQICRACHDK